MDADHAPITQTQFFYALRNGELEVARRAISQGADIRAPLDHTDTLVLPIHWAAQYPDCSFLDLLIEAGLRGADFEAPTTTGSRPLLFASMELWPNSSFFSKRRVAPHDWLPVHALLALGADPHAQDALGNTALHGAVDTLCMPAAKALIAHGADPRIPNLAGVTPLARALRWRATGAPDMHQLLFPAAEALDLMSAAPHPAFPTAARALRL